MAQGGGMAASMGVSLEQTVGILSLFDQNALKGSDAGTSLKTMLMSLTPTTEAASAAMDEIGLRAFDANGKFVGLNSVADQLKNGMKGMGDEQRIAALKTIFGNDAYRAANVLYEQGAAGLQRYVTQVSKSGVAAQVSAAKLNNAKGDLEKLKGSIQDVMIGAGEGANGPLRGLLQNVNSLVEGFGKLPPSVQSGVFQVAAFGSAGLLAAAGVIKLVNGVRSAAAGVVTMAGHVRDGAAAFRTWATSGNTGMTLLQGLRARAVSAGTAFTNMGTRGKVGAGLAAAGLLALTAAAVSSGDAIENAGRRSAQLSDDMIRATRDGSGFANMFKDLQVAGARDQSMSFAQAMDQLGSSLNGVNDKSAGVLKAIPLLGSAFKGANGPGAAVEERIRGMGKELADLVQSGDTMKAASQFQALATEAGKHGVSTDRLMKMMPEYSDALSRAANAGDKSAAASKRDAEAKAKQARDVEKLTDSYKSLNNVLLEQRGGARGYQAALDEATKAVAENGRTLDITTEKGRNNQAALDGVASAAGEWASSVYKATGSQQQANAVLVSARENYIRSATAMGMSRTEATKLANELIKIDGVNTADVKINGVEAARVEVNKLGQEVLKLDGSKVEIPASTTNGPQVLQMLTALKGATLDANKNQVKIPTSALQAPETRKAIEGIKGAVKDAKGNVTVPTSALNAEATRNALKQIDSIAVTADGRVVTIPASTPNAAAVKKLLEGVSGAAVSADGKSVSIPVAAPNSPQTKALLNSVEGAALSADKKSVSVPTSALGAVSAKSQIDGVTAAARAANGRTATVTITTRRINETINRAITMPSRSLLGLAQGGPVIASMPRHARGNQVIDGVEYGFMNGLVGGAVKGPGTGTSDQVLTASSRGLIRTANGEHILTAREVAQAGGHEAIYRLRAGIRSGAIRGFASGGANDDWTPDMSGIMSYASSLKVDSGSVSEQRKRLQDQESKLRKATRDLKAARAALSRASGKSRIAAENRVADAVERQAKATRDVATSRSTLSRLSSQSKMDTTSRFLTAGKQQNKVSAKFVKDVEKIGSRGFGRLAQSLLEDGSDEARAIASKLAGGSLSQLGRAQGQLATSDAIAGRKAKAAERLSILNDPLVREQQGNLAMWQRRLDTANRDLANARKRMNGTSGAARKRAEEEVTVALQRQARAARDVANSRARLNALAPKSLTIASTFVRDRTSSNTITQRFLDDVEKIKKAGFGPLAADLLNAGDEGAASKARSLVQGGLAQMRAADKAVRQSSALDARRKSITDALSAASLSPSERSAANQQLIALRGANAAMAYAGGPQKITLDVDYGRLAKAVTAGMPAPVRSGPVVLQMDGREVARGTSPHLFEDASTRAGYGSVIPNFR